MSSNSTTALDVDRARRDTPAVNATLHFNNAGAALMPQQVLDAVVSHLQLEAQIGGYEAEHQRQDKIERVYDSLAQLLNCHRDEIAFVENATRAWDMAFYGLRFNPGDRIVTAASEYASNYIAFLQAQKSSGVTITVVPNDDAGQLDLDALKKSLDERVKLIAITQVPTNGGLVNPAVEIGKIAKAAGITYLLDACQAVGQLEIDVQEIGCDILSATGRKFLRGPRGTGFLYASKKILQNLEPPFLDLHAAEWKSREEYVVRPDARRFENWESNYAGKIGLAVAVDYALEWGIANIEERVVALAEQLRQSLAMVPSVTVHDQGRKKCGIVTFEVANIPAAEIQKRLGQHRMNVSISNLAYNWLNMEDRGLKSLVRASVHYYNTSEEIDKFCAQLHNIIKTSS